MFTIWENGCKEAMMVTNVVGTVDENNTAIITWEWPRNNKFNLCVVFAVEEDEPLEELLDRNAPGTVYEDEFGVYHRGEIGKSKVRFKVFPAIRTSPKVIQIVNQQRDNLSQYFNKRIDLEWHIEYKTSLFSQMKKGLLYLKGLENLADNYLLYRCVGNQNHIHYPIDLNKYRNQKQFTVFLDKKEELQLVLTEHQKEYINLVYR